MMRGATLSSSTGADFVCLRSNYECRSYFCFFFADDCGLDAAEQTCQFPIITLFVSTTAHGDVHAPFRCSRLSPDAARLLLFGGELDNFVQVWDLTTFQLVGQAKVAGPEHASPRSALRDLWDNVFFTNFEYVDDHMWDNALVSPNGRRAFLPNEPSNTLIEFSLDPVAHEGQIPAPHTAFITAQCLIPGKNQAATASADGSIALWQFAETEIHDGPAPQTFGGTLRQRIRQHPDFPDRHGECVTFENFAAHLAQARR